jgi:hypothetical protein
VDIPAPPVDNRESGMTDEWPLRSFIELGAYTGAVRCARLHARLVLREWGFTGLGDTCAQVISELVTNTGAPRGALLYPRCSREELKGGSWA